MNDQNNIPYGEELLEQGNLREIKIEKLKKLKEKGIDPFVASSKRTTAINTFLENFDSYNEDQSPVVLAGRIMNIRSFGKLHFIVLKSESDTIQIVVSAKDLTNAQLVNNLISFEGVELLDIGDFIDARGTAMITKKGEKSLLVSDLRLLTKSIETLPSEYFGLKDEEERYRKRYVDILLNDDVRDMFYKKSKFWQSIRNFMLDRGFLEVETPVLENTAGGADASPFVTHHNALDIDVFLRISMGELWQKRLMVAGFEKTFEIGRQFRNEGQSREHLQDYTQMEFYWAYADYKDGMQLVEQMYKKVAYETFGTYEFDIFEHRVNLNQEWQRVDYAEILREKLDVDIVNDTIDLLREKCNKNAVKFEMADDRGRLIDLLWKKIRKTISGPAFLINHPEVVSPLAKRKSDNPALVERFQIIIAGSEQGNGYSELNDPIDQNERFKKQQELRDAGDAEAQMHDREYVNALEYGMPPTCGFGVSERLFSFLANKPIKDAVLFPLLRPETSNQ